MAGKFIAIILQHWVSRLQIQAYIGEPVLWTRPHKRVGRSRSAADGAGHGFYAIRSARESATQDIVESVAGLNECSRAILRERFLESPSTPPARSSR
jgi:hypothetical protein